jgi:hypothetical protein
MDTEDVRDAVDAAIGSFGLAEQKFNEAGTVGAARKGIRDMIRNIEALEDLNAEPALITNLRERLDRARESYDVSMQRYQVQDDPDRMRALFEQELASGTPERLAERSAEIYNRFGVTRPNPTPVSTARPAAAAAAGSRVITGNDLETQYPTAFNATSPDVLGAALTAVPEAHRGPVAHHVFVRNRNKAGWTHTLDTIKQHIRDGAVRLGADGAKTYFLQDSDLYVKAPGYAKCQLALHGSSTKKTATARRGGRRGNPAMCYQTAGDLIARGSAGGHLKKLPDKYPPIEILIEAYKVLMNATYQQGLAAASAFNSKVNKVLRKTRRAEAAIDRELAKVARGANRDALRDDKKAKAAVNDFKQKRKGGVLSRI